MASFKDKGYSGEEIRLDWFPRAIVYLESQDDCLVIAERWFFEVRDEIEFRAADAEGAGGARQVIDKVIAEHIAERLAYGIVDRDSLLTAGLWELWWETDDDRFAAARPFGGCIRVLRRWELENYLVHPTAIERIFAAREARPLRRELDVIASDLLTRINVCKLLSACHMVFHHYGERLDHAYDGAQDSAMHELLSRLVADRFGVQGTALFTNFVERIEGFAIGDDNGPIVRLDKLMRILDGKRVLRRLDCYARSHSKEDMRFFIADHVGNAIDPEIRGYIEEFRMARRVSVH